MGGVEMTDGASRPMVSMRHAGSLVGVLVLVGLAAAAWPFTVDDAFIVARYATRIAQGLGYTFVDGVVSDGVTGPLWLVPLVLGVRLGLAPVTLAKWLSLVAGLVALAMVLVRTKRGSRGDRATWIAGLVACGSLSLVVWSVAGLETGLSTLCATWLALATTSRRPAHVGWLGLALFALAGLRPELLPLGVSLCLTLMLRDRPRALRALALGLLGVFVVGVSRKLTFGHWLPMTASAKPALLQHGVAYLVDALWSPRAALLALLLAIAAIEGKGTTRALVLALAVHAASVLLVGGDWMPGRRLFAPTVPMLALAIALGTRRLVARRPYLSLTVLMLLLASSARELASELTVVREAGARRERELPALAAHVCAARGPVALIDLGALSLACPAQSFVDLGGLTEPALAYARGAHLDKRVDEAWLAERAPGLVLLHSREPPLVDEQRRLRWFAGHPVERRVLSFAFMRAYRVQRVFAYAPSYYYVSLVPRDIAASP